MQVGVPKGIKDGERRVALTPFGAATLTRAGHEVLVERGAGMGSGFDDEEYRAAGARIVNNAAAAWSAALVVKVKEPLSGEYGLLHSGLTLFTFLHLAAEPELTRVLVDRNTTAIAYETVQRADGSLPLLAPMSAVAGRMAAQVAAHLLMSASGGRGKLLGGVPGVPPGRVVVLGAGTAGTQAARIALGMGARVTLFDVNLERLRALDATLGGRLETAASSAPRIAEAALDADVVIGAVLLAGARAPVLLTEATVAAMQPGAVIIDIAVDQGGCVQTIRRTTHSDPAYIAHGVVHYGVANMPGAVPRTSTMALCDATLPYIQYLAAQGIPGALDDASLAMGVNTYAGTVTHPAVAEALGIEVAKERPPFDP